MLQDLTILFRLDFNYILQVIYIFKRDYNSYQ